MRCAARRLVRALAEAVCLTAMGAEPERGPKVGEVVPQFSAQDETGKPRTLADLSGPKGLLFIFPRSAAW